MNVAHKVSVLHLDCGVPESVFFVTGFSSYGLIIFCVSLFIWHTLTWFLVCLQCFTIEKLGRRPLMIGGFAVMGVCSVGITLAFSFQVCAHMHTCIRVSVPIIRKVEMIKNWCLQQNRSLWVLFKVGLSKFHTLT